MLSYPMSTGRNFDEILRALDSIQLTAKHKVSTPVNWKPGDSVIISGALSNDESTEALSRRMEVAKALSEDCAGGKVGAES